MSTEPIDLDTLRAQVTKQAGLVRTLKAEGAAPEVLSKAIADLQVMRKQLDELAADEGGMAKWTVDKRALDDCVTRRMFVVPSFEIHGGCAGFFDYGPPGCALKENLLALWRQHFILEDSLLQIECTTLTPHVVLKTSGHVDKFEDLMVKDVKNGDCYRADKLLEDFIDNKLTKDKEMPSAEREALRKIAAQAGSYTKEQIAVKFKELDIKAPATGNDLTDPFQFNLMFATSIGPTGTQQGFLRPETAQGMFVNFRRLYDYNLARVPMGVAQIGTAYRNEIAPRGGLLRVREFTMAEIEFFVNPANKDHTKFASVKDLRLTLFPAENQIGNGKTVTPTLGEAVAAGTINNQTLAYFMGRTALFLLKAGVKTEGLRFRQHLRTEMAHYACDCWDAEILMSTGWVECVGIADRSAFDLKVHAKASKVELVAREVYPEPREEDVITVKVDAKITGRVFKGDNAAVTEALQAMAEDRERALAFGAALEASGSAELSAAGKTFTITKEMVKIAETRQRVTERKFVPNVIEPSFGIGRIITGILEHNFSMRQGDDQRCVLSFPPVVAPFKAVLLPLDSRIAREPLVALGSSLTGLGISNSLDDTNASVGKRYSRADEVGIPFAVTYDHQSGSDGAVTLRERDTCAQIRLPLAELPRVLKALVDGTMTWATAMASFTVVTTGEDKAASAGAGGAVAAAAAPAAATAAAPAAAAAAPAAAAHGKATGGSIGVVREGDDRLYGRFMRPAKL